jgi:twitching motility protein PilT
MAMAPDLITYASAIFEANPQVSDIHLREGRKAYTRLNGVLVQDPESTLVSREALERLLTSDPDQTGLSTSAEVSAKILKGGVEHDFSVKLAGCRARGTAFSQDGGKLGVALRRIPAEAPDIDSLGLPGFLRDNVANSSSGLFLVTGATGSGKSTTLAALVRHINRTSNRHILTLEDPVEFVHEDIRSLVTQRAMGRDTKAFGAGLRAAMRQDPDVILIGEIRDLETVHAAMDAANTGHLVLGTLHTMSAQQTVDRILSFFSTDDKEWAAQVLASTLRGVMSQVLVPKADGTGRMLCYELLVNTLPIRNHIHTRNVKSIFNEMDTGSSNGHVLLNRNLEEAVRTLRITPEAAAYAAYDPTKLSFWKTLSYE